MRLPSVRGRRAIRALALALLAGACSEPPPPDEPIDIEALRRIVTDDAGYEHRIGRARDRVISLVPAITDFIVAFGESGRIIARTRYDEDPTLANLPSVGGGLDPSVERIVFLKPDLVIVWPDVGDRSVAARLEELGITVYQARVETIADARRHAIGVASLLGARPQANRWAAELDSTFARIGRDVEGKARPGVVYVASAAPPIVAGSGTFVDSLVTVAGGRNVFGSATQPWPQVSMEAVARGRPDVVLVPSAGGIDSALRSGGWGVVSGRRVALDPTLFGRPGPRLGEAAQTLLQTLHPEPER